MLDEGRHFPSFGSSRPPLLRCTSTIKSGQIIASALKAKIDICSKFRPPCIVYASVTWRHTAPLGTGGSSKVVVMQWCWKRRLRPCLLGWTLSLLVVAVSMSAQPQDTIAGAPAVAGDAGSAPTVAEAQGASGNKDKQDRIPDNRTPYYPQCTTIPGCQFCPDDEDVCTACWYKLGASRFVLDDTKCGE